MAEEEDKFKLGGTSLALDDDKEKGILSNNVYLEEEFLKPSYLVDEESPENNIIKENTNLNEETKTKQKPEEEYLFSATKLSFDEGDIKKQINELVVKSGEILYDESTLNDNKRKEDNSNTNQTKNEEMKREYENESINKIVITEQHGEEKNEKEIINEQTTEFKNFETDAEKNELMKIMVKNIW